MIDLNEKDEKLLVTSFKKNKEFLKTMNLEKEEIHRGLFQAVRWCLNYKYVHK